MLKKELTLNSESALQRVYSYSLSCTFYEQDSQWLHFWSCSGVSTSSANIMGCEFNSVMTSHTSTMGDIYVSTGLYFYLTPDWNVEKWGNTINLYREDTGDMRVLTYSGVSDDGTVAGYACNEAKGGPYFLSEADHWKTIPIRVEIL